MPGPAKQPEKVARLKGTYQPCRAPDPHLEAPTLDTVPEPPEWMTGGLALNLWKRRATMLVGMGVLAEVDTEFLAIFVSLEAKIIKLQEAGELPHASMLSQYKAFANELGIGPASRMKFKLPEKEKKTNKFARD